MKLANNKATLSFSNGQSAAWYDTQNRKMAAFMPQMYAARSASERTPNLLYDAYPGLRVAGANLWLTNKPVSAAVSFEVFVRPALLTMQGRRTVERARLTLPAGTSWRTPEGRRQYLPAVIDTSAPTWTVHPATAGGSVIGGPGCQRSHRQGPPASVGPTASR